MFLCCQKSSGKNSYQQKTFFSCFKPFNQIIGHQTSVFLPKEVIESLDMLSASCCRPQKTQKSFLLDLLAAVRKRSSKWLAKPRLIFR
jgi:hypothetical protein